ncbi:hypothetical protein HU200_024580 [Digitaria exilis]|uniref:chitinase n=1 Tax=Digitaria exilis TaxID=1010633 RepID=A0A835C358_9POAL|nr:hypothetical protein HU200_024580 [Digitaria exilis]
MGSTVVKRCSSTESWQLVRLCAFEIGSRWHRYRSRGQKVVVGVGSYNLISTHPHGTHRLVPGTPSAANLNAMTVALALTVLAFAYAARLAHAQQCGAQAGGALCPNNLCCSKYGYCGRSCDHCGAGCQSQCTAGSAHGGAATKPPRCGAQAGGAACPDGLCCSRYGFCGLGVDHCGDGCQGQCARGVASVLTRDVFERMLPHRDDAACPARGFYTYDAFVAAARAFPAFAATGDATARKREVAAFLAQTSHETSGIYVAR